MENEENSVSVYRVIRDRYGKKHKVYSARFKDIQTVTDFTTKYDPGSFALYAMAPVIDEDGEVDMLPDGRVNFDNGFADDVMEIVELALDYRETREQINEWLDLETAAQIVELLLGLSTFKKKTEIKAGEETHWRNLFASLVKNTSLTMQDIENLRINQMEDLLVGLSENAEKEQAELNGESTNGVLEGDDAIRALLGE